MFARCLILMCFICLFASCTSFFDQMDNTSKDLVASKQLYPVTAVRSVPAFTQVYIQGPFNVRLHTNKNQKPSLKIESEKTDLPHIQSYVKRGVLYVSNGPRKAHIGTRQLRMKEATLEINVPVLHGFTYNGEGEITAHQIHSSLLDIWINNSKTSTWDGKINLRRLTVLGDGEFKMTGIHSRNLWVKLMGAPKVTLKGEANLRRLDIEGRGVLRLYWIKSADLIIRLKGYAQLTLAGTVKRLDGVFSDHSHFNGRYLRVQEAFVKTNGEAVSDISVVGTQHALARDRSDIYYYNLPGLRVDFMARNGSVLDMRPEALKAVQPHTTYDR